MKIVHAIGGHHPRWENYWDEFIDYVKDEINLLHHEGMDCHVDYPASLEISLYCHRSLDHLSSDFVKERCRHAFGNALANFIMEVLEKPFILQLLQQHYHDQNQNELQSIYEYCYQMLWLSDDTVEGFTQDECKVEERRRQIFCQAYDYLQEESIVHLEGFIRFRLKDYFNDLQRVAEFAIDEYILDQEYEEFVRLLRYFISMQSSKIPLLHVIHTEGEQFQLLDEEGEFLKEKEFYQQTTEWSLQTNEEEEFIMSTLMTLAPQKIILHTDTAQLTIVQTLRHVFEERITICTGCKQCRKWKKYQASLEGDFSF